MADKERLENMVALGVDGQGYVLIKGEDFHWLMEQAERVEELENRFKLFDSWYRTAYQQNERYRKALEFYADENNYREQELKGIVPPRPITLKPILHDYGSIARKALEGE